MKVLMNALLWTCVLCFPNFALADEAAVADLGLLTGCWSVDDKGTITEERWSSSAGGLLLGSAKTIAKGAIQQYEFLRVSRGADGKVIYTAVINGEKTVDFTLTQLDKASKLAAFENPENEFPKRVQYWRTDKNTLTVSLSAGEKLVSYSLKKIACD